MQENSYTWEVTPQPIATVEPIKKEKANAFLFSIVALILVLAIGGAMIGLRIMKEASIQNLQDQTNEITQKVETIKKNKEIVIASLLSNNSLTPSINLKKLVLDFNIASRQAQVRFQGFSVKDDIISTNLIAFQQNPMVDSAESIFRMMEIYKKSAGKSNFSLEPILSISGTPQNRTTPIQFKIVPIAPEGATAKTGTGITQ